MPRSTTETAVAGIERYIRNHHLNPGDVLPSETELCRSLDCSRSSLREAMRTLQSLDIVEIRRGQGTFISTMSLSPLMRSMVLRITLDSARSAKHLLEIVETRQVFETAVAKELIAAHTPESLKRLEDTVMAMRLAVADHGTFVAEEELFHCQLLHPISNGFIRELAAALWQIQSTVVSLLSISISSDSEHTIDTHANMVQALVAKDAAAFKKAVQQHYDPVRDAITTLEWKQPETS